MNGSSVRACLVWDGLKASFDGRCLGDPRFFFPQGAIEEVVYKVLLGTHFAL